MTRIRSILSSDHGFTIIEVIVVMILISILAGIFAETINSAMLIYSDQIQRKDTHTDMRRSFDFMTHSLREWKSWQSSPSGTLLDFYRYSRFADNSGNIYYDNLREAYTMTSQSIYYRRDDEDWANQYLLLEGGVASSPTPFSTTTAGGILRVNATVYVTHNDKPLKMAVTIFPRPQGG